MKSNQSLHLVVKEPPNPKPIHSLGVFSDPDNPSLPAIINHFLSTKAFDPKDKEFEGNVKDEVLKLVAKAKPVAVARKANITIVYFEDHDAPAIQDIKTDTD